MLWYLLKTWAGGEERLVKEIRRTVPPYMYEEAFVIYNERIWRRQGRSIIHPEPLFKGYVFLTCRETEPLFRRLELIPAMSRLMAAGDFAMLPLRKEDAEFLRMITGDDHVLRPSCVLREDDNRQRDLIRFRSPHVLAALPEQRQVEEDGADQSGSERSSSGWSNAGQNSSDRGVAGQSDSERGSTYRIAGPLENCLSDIEDFEFRKRFVKIRKKLWDEDRVIAMGIILNEDVEKKLIYGDMEISVEVPEDCQIMEIEKDAEGKTICRVKENEKILPQRDEGMMMVG